MISKTLLLLFLFSLIPIKIYGDSWGSNKSEETKVEHQFKTIHSLREVKEELNGPKDALIVFDVDYVLTHPTEPAYQFPNFAKHLNFVMKTFSELTNVQRDVFANLMVFDNEEGALVEDIATDLITSLHKEGYKSIALTATLTSFLDGVNLKEKRANRLKELGIDFASSFPDHETIEFKTLESNMNTYPQFYHGILFSNGENLVIQKGPVLKEFLKSVNYSPKTILVIDDREKNLIAISETFKDTPVTVRGLLYRGSLKFPSKRVDSEAFENMWLNLAQKAKDLSVKLSNPAS